MTGEIAVLLVGDVPGGTLAGDDGRLSVATVEDLDQRSDRPIPDGQTADVAVVESGSVGAAVDRLAVPVVGSTPSPSEALEAGADEWLPPDAPAELVSRRIGAVVDERRTQRRVDALFDDPLTGRIVVDGEGRIQAVNDTGLASTGQIRESVLGETIWELPWAERSPEAAAAYRRGIEGASDGEMVRERSEAGDAQGVDRTVDALFRPIDGDRVLVEARDVGMLLDEDAALEPPSRRLRTIVDTLPILVFAFDDDGTFTLSEGRGLELLGMEPGEVVGDSVFDVYADSERIVDAAERSLDGEEVTVTTEAGGRVWESWFQPVGDDGVVRSVLGAAIDVTERVERERELERYRTLVDTVGDPMYILDTEGRIEMVNEAMAEHLGYERDELVGEHVSLVLDEEDVAEGKRLIADLLDDDDRRWGTYELTVISADGDRTPYEDHIGVITDDDGAFRGSVGVVRNLEERLARERELEQYETIVETVPDGVFVLDEDGTMLGGNDTAARMLGYDRAELEGEPFEWLVNEGVVDPSVLERYLDIVRELLSSDSDREKGRFEVELFPQDGGRRVVEVHVALRPFDERYRGTFGVVRDVTDRREREHQLRQQNERLEEFASAVSHDLRNPLSVARGTADLLADEVDAGELDQIIRSLDRMDDLVEDLLELARTGQTVTAPTAVDVSAVAADAWSTVAVTDGGLAVRTDAVVEADRSRLRQLLENLFRNAVEHAGEAPRIEVGDLDGGRGFYVADDGPGIPEDERDRVLEHGYTTAQDGTGFGLAIVRSVAAAHGWEIAVEESEQGGARFAFTGVEPGR